MEKRRGEEWRPGMRVAVCNTKERPARYREGRIVDRSWGREGGRPIYRFSVQLDNVEGQYIFNPEELRAPDPDLPADEIAFMLGERPVTFAETQSAESFMQAVAQHFGHRINAEIKETTRFAVMRFLRLVSARQHLELADGRDELSEPIRFTTSQGWSLTIGTDIRPEALAQLLDLHSASSPIVDAVPYSLLAWRENAWRLSGSLRGQPVELFWNPSSSRWE
ncbi:hypothetical protein [Streptomyces malaysiensis]|uniref:hypothetical protein n=1 Tax=Streptomyces malaysiensis TaxID=92644 RepID=UPI0033F8191F